MIAIDWGTSSFRAWRLDDAGRARNELAARLLGRDLDAAPPPLFAGAPRGAASELPRPGDIALVRHRQYLVEEVIARPLFGEATRVRMVCLDDDDQGRPLEVLWELELGARVLQPETHGLGDVTALDPPTHFAAYLHALRWHAVTATDARLFQAPFRAGIELMNHQLTPLKKALELPRANLFIADDVGLGKTIEAGLVLQELLLRQQVELVLIVAPAAVCLQWQGEMQRRFGLHFEIYNRAFMARRRQERGFGCNPWTTHNRFIISYQTLRRPEYRDPLLARYLGFPLVEGPDHRVLASYKGVIAEDAATQVSSHSLRLDTARYTLSANTRAFGLRVKAFRDRCTYDGGFDDELTLFVVEGRAIRPVLAETMSRWWHGPGNRCGGEETPRIDSNVTISVEPTASHGLADLRFTAVRSDGKKPVSAVVRYDGKSYDLGRWRAALNAWWY